MSSYVRRERDGRVGWVGPIRAASRAEREKAAWESAGWAATVVPVTLDSRRAVREWVKEVAARRAAGC